MPINQSIVTTLKYDAALKVKNQASNLLRDAQKKNQKLAVGLVHFTLRISKKKKIISIQQQNLKTSLNSLARK